MVREVEKKSEIVLISKRYKNTLTDLIDSLDIELSDQLDFLNSLRLIDKKSYNILKFRSNLSTLSEKNCLDVNVLITLL